MQEQTDIIHYLTNETLNPDLKIDYYPVIIEETLYFLTTL